MLMRGFGAPRSLRSLRCSNPRLSIKGVSIRSLSNMSVNRAPALTYPQFGTSR